MLQYRTGCSLYRFFTVFAGEELCVKRGSLGASAKSAGKGGCTHFSVAAQRHRLSAKWPFDDSTRSRNMIFTGIVDARMRAPRTR